ncbi:translation initiation factor IF-2-like [Passer montanus]|uniref:translation initiation factor IF-2-like n=1 Tax=Passer montanus TaxID=9160 RepID=UPI0019614DDD|nr:translation initiation factor IF-2-like [Passer montanus]
MRRGTEGVGAGGIPPLGAAATPPRGVLGSPQFSPCSLSPPRQGPSIKGAAAPRDPPSPTDPREAPLLEGPPEMRPLQLPQKRPLATPIPARPGNAESPQALCEGTKLPEGAAEVRRGRAAPHYPWGVWEGLQPELGPGAAPHHPHWGATVHRWRLREGLQPEFQPGHTPGRNPSAARTAGSASGSDAHRGAAGQMQGMWKSFSASSNLRRHRRNRGRERPHLCPECGDTFWTPGQLRRHCREHVV